MLEQALAHMPSDNALGTARSYVSRAIEEIARVEKKRDRRFQQQANPQSHSWSYDPALQRLVAPMSEAQKRAVIGQIDKMIEDEKQKLESLKKDFGSDQTLLG